MGMGERGVWRFPAHDGIRLVGLKANGKLAFDLFVPLADFHPSMEERGWRWLDKIDPPLRLIVSSD